MAEGEEYNVVTWNAELEVSRNIVGLLRQVEVARQNRDIFHMMDFLDGAYIEASQKLNKTEKEELENIRKTIDMHNLKDWDKVVAFSIRLRKALDDHGFLSAKGVDPRQAVYNR